MIREEICASVPRGGLYSNLVYLPITRLVLARITRLRTDGRGNDARSLAGCSGRGRLAKRVQLAGSGTIASEI